MIDEEKQLAWDKYFLGIVDAVAQKSKDPSTKVGALIVRTDHSICSSGYNGFPRGMEDRPERYDNRAEKYERVIHAEMNAILTAPEPVHGYTLYVPFLTCANCCKHVIQAGIKRVVCRHADRKLEERWKPDFERAISYFRECGVEVVFIND